VLSPEHKVKLAEEVIVTDGSDSPKRFASMYLNSCDQKLRSVKRYKCSAFHKCAMDLLQQKRVISKIPLVEKNSASSNCCGISENSWVAQTNR